MAASWRVSLRAGSGRRTLLPDRLGRSAANETSRSPLRAMARRQPITDRLNGSVGDSFDGVLGLMFDVITAPFAGNDECDLLGNRRAGRTRGSRVSCRSPGPD